MEVIVHRVVRLVGPRPAAEVHHAGARLAVGGRDPAEVPCYARLRCRRGELDERVAVEPAVLKRNAVVGEVAVRQAVFVVPAVDRLGGDGVKLDVPVDVRVVVGVVDAEGRVPDPQAVE